MLKVSECKSKKELENYLELTYGELEEARERNMIPASYLLLLLKKCHLSAKWILTGIGKSYNDGTSPEYNAIINSFSEEIDLIMKLAEENKRVRKKFYTFMEGKADFYHKNIVSEVLLSSIYILQAGIL